MTMSDKIVVMNDGEIMQIGAPDEVYEEPNNVFVATFIGTPSMNILEAEKAGSTLTVEGIGTVELGDAVPSSIIDGDVTVGFRPETVDLTEPTAEGLTAEVQVVESTGSQRIVYMESPQGELRVETGRTLSRIEELETYGLELDSDELLYFDADTGERIETERAHPQAPQE